MPREPYAFRDGPHDQWRRCTAAGARRALEWRPKFDVIEWATQRYVFSVRQLEVLEAIRNPRAKRRRRSA
jgi:hypothetical protein